VAGSVGLGLATWAVLWSPLLRVSEVKVVGGENTSSADVAKAAGLGPEDHLLTISTTTIEADAEELPWVKTAQVDRVLPGTVRVKITERKPAVTLSIGAAAWMVDATGRVLGPGRAGEGKPTLAGVEVDGVVPGRPVGSAAASDALAAWRSFSPAMRADVQAIFAPTLERITFVLMNGTQVRYGAAEELEAKNSVLKAILARLATEGRTPAYIDVRVPAHPAVGDDFPDGSPSPSPSPSPSSP
jgi:cell division protein FtsQ